MDDSSSASSLQQLSSWSLKNDVWITIRSSYRSFWLLTEQRNAASRCHLLLAYSCAITARSRSCKMHRTECSYEIKLNSKIILQQVGVPLSINETRCILMFSVQIILEFWTCHNLHFIYLGLWSLVCAQEYLLDLSQSFQPGATPTKLK